MATATLGSGGNVEIQDVATAAAIRNRSVHWALGPAHCVLKEAIAARLP